ncbi:MAG: hypothetical protein QOF62_2141 [Pyrinomonadaceae bacterium]|jgi:hypothetical protein|nr:hypothetical protein [Pyrinomonadaceae bacterium]
MSKYSSRVGKGEADAGGMLLETLSTSGSPGPVPTIIVEGRKIIGVRGKDTIDSHIKASPF